MPQERTKRKLLLPMNTAGKEIALVSSPKHGFVPLSEGINLGTIAEGIRRENDGVTADDHAIPSFLAHLIYTKDVVELYTQKDSSQDHDAQDSPEKGRRRRYFGAEALYPWQGILSIVGLSRQYGFRLSLEYLDLREGNTLLERILSDALRREGVACDGVLPVICKDSIPLAAVHPDILFCPFKEIPAQALRDVPWVQDGVFGDVIPCLKEDEREILAAWISTFQGEARPMTAATLDDLSRRLLAHTQDTLNRVRAVESSHPLYRAWCGVLAMIGLSQMYGYSISFREVDPLKNPVAMDLIQKCLPKGAAAPSGGSLLVVYRDNHPLAVIHPDILLCPLEHIHPDALAGVPWYRDGEFTDVAASVGEAERDSLSYWLHSFLATSQLVKPALDAFLMALSGGRPLSRPGNTVILGDVQLLEQQRVGIQSPEDFLKAPGFPVEMPTIFNDRLAVVFADKRCELGVGHSLSFEEKIKNKPVYFNALLPLTPELTASFEQHDNDPVLRLKDISIDVSRFSSDRSVTVTATLQNGSFFPQRSHTYTADHIDYIPNLPYLTLWPYVSLPPTDWSLYYVSQLNNPDTGTGTGIVDRVNEVNGDRLCIDCAPKLKESGYETYSWKVAVLHRMPRCIHFYYRENNEVRQAGCLFINPPEDPSLRCTNFHKTAVVGVDFGTTNTICSIKSDENGSLSHQIVRGAYLKDLTPPKRPEIKTIFTSQYWMPQEDKDGRFLSIAQLYANHSDHSEMLPYEDGSMMFVDQKVLNYFLSQSGGGRLRTLSEIGIYNDMKFGRAPNEGGSAEESFAAQIFMKNVLLCATLAAKLQGANRIHLNISYPQEKVKRSLQAHWNEACSFIEGMGINLTFTAPEASTKSERIQYMTEAEAASRFFDQRLSDSLAADFQAGFAIVDIGGGTADISVWKADPLDPGEPQKPNSAKLKGAFSLLYAGRDIVVKSLYQQYRSGATEEFKNLWCSSENADPETLRLIALYDALVKQVNDNHNLDADPTYKNVRVILDTLIDKSSFQYDHIFRSGKREKYSKLVAAIRMKFLNVFYVLAHYIRLLLAADQSAGVFKIFLAGGSSQALRFCSLGEDLRGFSDSDFGTYLRVVIGEVLGIHPDSIQIVEPQTSDKREVAIGLTIPAADVKNTEPSSQLFGRLDEPEPAQAIPAAAPRCDLGQLREQYRQVYDEYIHRYMHRNGGTFVYWSESGERDLFERLDLSVPENLRRYNQSKLFSKVYGNEEYPSEIKPYIFAALMADGLL